MTNIKEIYQNEVYKKIGRAMQELKANNKSDWNLIYIYITKNIPDRRADRFMHFISMLLDKYCIQFNKSILSEQELRDLVNGLNDEDIAIIKNVILTYSNTSWED
jgi:hypothetical protein